MIIARAPFRISFSGGGSDIPSYYERNGGAVISTSINKYVYIEAHPFFDHTRIQLKYSRTENVDSPTKISHRIFQRVLSKYDLNGIELTSTADIPTGTGMGSSSAFTTALLQCVHAYRGRFRSQEQLAEEACKVEIEDLGAPIGKQDQYASALGGLNFITFHRDGSVEAQPVLCKRESLDRLDQSLMLFYTGVQRDANEVLSRQVSEMNKDTKKIDVLTEMVSIARKMRVALEEDQLDSFGKLLDDTWQLKRTLTSGISNSEIDDLYHLARDHGALGGKLLGAGNGGFLLFYCPLDRQKLLRSALGHLKEVPFTFESGGTRVIYYQQ